MKQVTIILTVLLVACSLYAVSLPTPLSYYDFEEGTGIDVADLGPAANNAKFWGTAIDWNTGGIVNQVGDPDGCVELLGDSFTELSFVEVPYAEFHDSPNYTFTAWVQWIGEPNWGYLFWQSGEVFPDLQVRHVDLWFHAGNQSLAAYPFDEDSTGYAMTPNADDLGIYVMDGDWHLVGITLEDSTILKMWVDGMIIAQDTSDVPMITNGYDNLWIGARPNDAEMNTCIKMTGLVDRVRIFDEALTEEQMEYLYDIEGPDGGIIDPNALPAPLSYYDFEEGTGIDVADLGSAANDAKFWGTAIDWNTGGIVNQVGDPDGCVELLGDSFTELSFVEVPYAEFHDSPNYTFSAWVQWIGEPNWGYLFWQSGEVFPDLQVRHVDLWFHAGNQSLAAYPFDEDSTGYAMTPNADDLGIYVMDGDWHLVGITLEDSTILKMWVDGMIIAQDTSDVPMITNGYDNLWIGARPNDAEMNTCIKMTGLVDRVRIWDQALTEEQWETLYDQEGPNGGVTSVEDNTSTPVEFSLKANYPNPFNPSTTIAYSLDRTQNATIEVFDLLGKKVQTLTSGIQSAGNHQAQWNGLNDAGQTVSSGVYFYQLKTADRVETRKMMFLK